MKRSVFLITSVISICLALLCGPVRTASAEELTLMAVGDILPHASWQPFQIPTQKLYEGVIPTLFEANLVIGNLECPLTDKVKPTSSKSEESIQDKRNFVFKAEDEDTAQGLRDAGFTVLTLANNHILDYREDGLLDTMNRLFKAGIKTSGAGKDAAEAGRPCVVKAGGSEVVVLAASDVVPKGFEAGPGTPGIVSMKRANTFIAQVREARKFYPDALLVLSLHWGTEATYTPSNRQKELARKLVDAGADLIIGHHPHRIQGVEIYNERPIFYSLGNFQFDTNKPGDETFIAKLVYTDGSRVPASISVVPVIINDGGFPVTLEPDTPGYNGIIERLVKLSGAFGLTIEGGRIITLPPVEEKGYDYWGT